MDHSGNGLELLECNMTGINLFLNCSCHFLIRNIIHYMRDFCDYAAFFGDLMILQLSPILVTNQHQTLVLFLNMDPPGTEAQAKFGIYSR